MRLPNGYGSVSKLSGKRRKPWRASLPLQIALQQDGTYKEIRPVLGYYRTRSEALQALAEFNRDPAIFNATVMTFSQLYELWAKEKYKDATKNTVSLYKVAYSRCEPIKNQKLSKLTNRSLQRLADTVASTYSTRKAVCELLSQVFRFAVKNNIIDRNPAESLQKGKQEVKIKRRPFTPEEVEKLWNEPQSMERDCVLILIYTGMRVNELYTLKTADAHLADRYVIGGSKTEAGKNRIIPLSRKIMWLIEGLQGSGTERLLLPDHKTHGYYARINRYLAKINHKPHDTRYTFASLAENAGLPRLTTAKIMGHASGNITQDLYTKKTAQELVAAIDLI